MRKMSQTDFHPQHPEWLNKSFFERVIKYYSGDDEAKVNEFAIQSGSKPGESFASDLLRASINYATESESISISVIVKTIPLTQEGEIDGRQLFMTELKMYGETLIDINRVLLNAHGYENIKLFPR